MNEHTTILTSSSTVIKQSLSSTGSSSPVLVSTPTSFEVPDSTANSTLMDESGEAAGTATSSGEIAKTPASSDSQENPQSTPPTPKSEEDDAKTSLADKKEKKKANAKTKSKTENAKKVKEQGKKALSPKKKKKKAKPVVEVSSSESSSASSSDSSDDDESSSDDESSEDEREKREKEKKKQAKKAALKKKAAKLKAKKKKAKKSKKVDSSDESDSSDSESESEQDSSEEEKVKRKKKAKAKAKKAKQKKSKKYESSSDDSSSSSSESSSSESDSSEDEKPRHKRSKKKSKKSKVVDDDSSSETEKEDTSESGTRALTAADLKQIQLRKQLAATAAAAAVLQPQTDLTANATTTTTTAATAPAKKRKKNGLDFKRVDQVWDSKIRDYKYMESAEEQKDEFDSVFTVRRKFGWDNKYLETQVDIKSKLLRNALQVVFKDCKSISLVEDKPSIQPNMLYHFYEEIKKHTTKTLKSELRSAKKRKEKKQLTDQIAQCKLLLRYIDEDYKDIRKTLKPMLKAGTITYNLVWALFKPNTIIYTPTYGNKDDPRCFKVDYCYEEEDWFGNKKWNIEGRYLEYDGKVFGLGDHFVQINSFKGPRRIANIGAYPLSFYKDPEALREQLIERGKKFVALQGMNYRFQKGLAYMKVRRVVMKFNINGRVMIDPALFRRLNANYPLSYIKADDLSHEDEDEDSDSDEGCSDCGCDSNSDSDNESDTDQPKGRVVMWKNKEGKRYLIRLPASSSGPDISSQQLDVVADTEDSECEHSKHVFTEEELLIASPVVLGFSFSEKAWVEFSLAGIKEIEWNDEAFETLVLPPQIKQNLKGLVSSHRFNAARTIDDVIVGKGKGLNVVLHGPPGVGKTLTGESIAEFLRCPLYAVSSGELGTSAPQLERDLNRIMEITHSWGAILLLDEADVFLEARQPHDIHRNALVSVFLRLTEYYQGILFLTTNRVATFDEAFQSRIHMGIRYEDLTMKARKKIWMHHVGKVLAMSASSPDNDKDKEKTKGSAKDKDKSKDEPDAVNKCKPFREEDYDELSKKVMNGRQIKNAVKTSQAIAVAEKGVFSMAYVKRIMLAHTTFEEDMRGGTGYQDAMRSYT
ncbi:hypothetical protein DM02DRAFT_654094 [Periconia macrospinosa]|uniref:AAA+ ATPase domain-containing protein n=1 Tax=Periconia macrospinosa TaxID=97972 RepID=A0A2V1DV70_9PLEO|nr:hypothetical protein DM02DRAFT_654094 [Periconia macrospinosa]